MNKKSLAGKSGHTLVVSGLIFLLESLFPWRYNHPCRWHKETEITKIADRILLFQRDNEGWPKNCDMQAFLTDGQKDKVIAVKHISKLLSPLQLQKVGIVS